MSDPIVTSITLTGAEYVRLTARVKALEEALALDKPRAAWAEAIKKNGMLCHQMETLTARVKELEAEVDWHKENSARRGEAEAVVLRRVKALEEAYKIAEDALADAGLDDPLIAMRALLTPAHEIAAFSAAQEPLGAEFERVWDANADKLYEGK